MRDRTTFRAVETGVALLRAFRASGGAQFLWRDPPYEYEYTRPPIDILYGSDRLRRAIDAGDDASAVMRDWTRDEDAFRAIRERFLLY